ncbi:uncharacterized protein LOC107372147 isoform X1 [Tetranychus urticae]|uniref:uncharacterized protein LOC107372147 isoform X1 n=1 Tax=Tetranychus urticae TaxID=32264 RepID=UPI000D64F4E1|nr:uncharacterized protein LOC107372147 isoform X1 [Tetranychus urticae]
MDLSEFLYFYQSSSSSSVRVTNFENNDSIISLSQSKGPSINKMLMQVLSPSEETLKTCLNSDQHKNNDGCDNNSDYDQSTDSTNLNVDRFHLKTCSRFGSKLPELDYINSYDMASDSIFSDFLDQLVIDIVYHNNLSLSALDLIDYQNSETLYYQSYDDHQALQPNQHFTYNDYVKLRANTLLLARLGYKLTITLNTDNVEPEPWNPKVAKKILSVDYSQLSLVKDCYHAQAPLDRLETFLLADVVNAFQDDEPINLPDISRKVHTNPSPAKFVSICMRLKSLRKLCNNDKIVLISGSFYEIVSLNVVFKYNQSNDEWIIPEYRSRFGRRDFFLWDRPLHDAFLLAIEALPDRWRMDEVVESLTSLIIIFDPDAVGLDFPDSVRHEQYVYIYLLKRYLESVCETPCDASDNLYRLMVGVEKFRELGEILCQHMNEVVPGYHRSLRNLIVDEINSQKGEASFMF